MRLNRATNNLKTYEGAPARHISPEAALRRSVMSCLLWEKEFYEEGEDIADRIERLAAQVKPETAASLAVEARTQSKLRHVPLLLLLSLSRTAPQLLAGTMAQVIQRPDEMGELLALHWRKGKRPVPRQMRKGLQKALAKFDEYSLAKNDHARAAVRLRDVLRIARPKPETPEQSALFARITARELAVPDTWEVALSAGGDPRDTWTRLLVENKLGYLALLRNLRNMEAAGVDMRLVSEAILARRGAHRVLPFRFIAAARACPQMEPALDAALQESIKEMPVFEGRTIVLVDVSWSMNQRLSARSDLTRADAAAALASIIPFGVRVMTFSDHLVEVPPRKGVAGVDTILRSQGHGGTDLGGSIRYVNENVPHDRLIVITDEQSQSRVPNPLPGVRGYMINVASARNGVGYAPWVHIDGFSENVLAFIREYETH